MKARIFHHPLKFIVLFLALFLTHGTQAQSSCDSASVIQMDTSGEFYVNSNEIWFKFQATNNEVHIILSASSQTPRADINSVVLFGGNCQNLISIDTAINVSILEISHTNLIPNNYYYIKIEKADSNGFFNLMILESIIEIYKDDDCPPDPCTNILFNGDFESTHPLVLPNTPPSSGPINITGLTPFSQYPLYHDVILNNNYPSGHYTNLVCHWQSTHEYSNVLNPIIRFARIENQQLITNQPGYYLANLHCLPEDVYQPNIRVFNNVYLQAGITYDISFRYKLSSNSSNERLFFGFADVINPDENSLLTQIPGIFNNTTYGSTGTITYTPVTDHYSLVLFGYYSIDPICSSFNIYIDDIEISPPPPQDPPIISADNFICPGTSSITYTITNYDPVYVYQYTINGGAVQIAHGNTIVVDLTNFTSSYIDFEIWNWCENFGYHSAYFSCDPATSLPVTMDYTYNDGDVITQSLFTGENIFICGHVTTGQDVFFGDCNVYFAPMARLTVSPSTTLTIEYSNLTNGCDYFWDGVFAEDETASIIVRNNTLFSYAKNAIVSADNSTLDVTDAEFIDNLTGIHIKQYNPYYLPANPDGTPYPPPHNAYIASCSFEIITATTASQFLNKYSVPSSIPPMIGIRLDTVYNVTIGDDVSMAKRNYFNNLAYGIHAIWSDLRVINGQFDDIGDWYKISPNVDGYQRPLEGAIHCIKPKVQPGTSATLMLFSAIAASANIGGSGLKSCQFHNCRFGIYASKYRLIAENNQFSEQHYNAFFVNEGRQNCKVNSNTIYMKDGIWAPAKLNNISILFTRAIKPISGINTEIIGNTIYNTRIGIYALSHSSNPQSTCIRCTKIGSNQIYFNNTLITDGTKSYYGIELLNGDYARVAGNHIENQATAYSPVGNISFPPNDSVLTGINVAQSQDAWVYDNHQIIKMSQGIRAIGVCTNTQFSCNDLISCKYGFYFYPNSTIAATAISQQGWSGRASDNYWLNNVERIEGGLVTTTPSIPWYFRGDDVGSNPYSTFVAPSSGMYQYIFPYPNTNGDSYCVGLPFPGIGDDPSGEIREMRYGEIVREQLSFEVLEEEFEQMSEEYLYEILYTNPDVMNIGQPGDTLYQNFYNYLTNSTIAEFTTIRELMDEENFAQALLDNGQVIATTMIDQNRQLTNDIYLRSVAVDAEIDSTDNQALWAIALLTPYIGGDGVYAARAMLGIDPDDYGLAYRKGVETLANNKGNSDILVYPNPAGESITFEIVSEALKGASSMRLFNASGTLILIYHNFDENKIMVPLNTLKPGIYYYLYTTNSGKNASGKFVKK